MRVARILLAVAVSLAAATSAFGQSSVINSGAVTPGHVPMYVQGGIGSQVVATDSGPAGGGGIGLGLAEQLLTVRGSGTAPYSNAGTGPLGTNWCDYDAPITNSTGYHYLCFSPNSTSGGVTGGLLTYGAGGTASQLPFLFNMNGTTYQFPFTVGGIVGPGSSAIGDIAVWNNTIGSLLKDVPPTQIFGTQSANTVFAGPSSGAAAFPTYRNLVGGDFGSQTANTFLAAPNGSSGNPTFRGVALADLPGIGVGILGNTSGTAPPSLVTLDPTLSFSGSTLKCTTFGTSQAGCVPASGGGTANFLRADGTFAAPSTALVNGQPITPSKVNSICYVDGATITSFSNALTTCLSNSTIIVPSNQTFTANLTVSSSGLVIRCENNATITFSANVSLTLSGANVSIRDCNIVGQGTAVSTAPAFMVHGSGFELVNNTFSSFGSTAETGVVNLSGSGALDNIRIFNNNFASIADFSVAITGSGSIQHLRIVGNMMYNGLLLLPLSGATPLDWVVSNNNFGAYGYGGTGITCIEALGGNATIINATINGNTCELLANGTNSGQNDWALGGFNYLVFANNSYYSSSFSGATGYWPFELNTCTDCIVANNTIATSGSAGSTMVIENASRLQVTGNNITGTCTASTCYGIYVLQNVAGSFQGAVIKNNNINVTANTTGSAITYECNNAGATCSNIAISGNIIVNGSATAGSKGIWFKNTTSTFFGYIQQGPDNIRAAATGVVVDTGIGANICLTTGFNASTAAKSLGAGVVSTCN